MAPLVGLLVVRKLPRPVSSCMQRLVVPQNVNPMLRFTSMELESDRAVKKELAPQSVPITQVRCSMHSITNGKPTIRRAVAAMPRRGMTHLTIATVAGMVRAAYGPWLEAFP